jgi:serine/threonine protein phosphatase 1
MNNRTFIIGDVHGCSKTLEYMLYQRLNITKEDNIYFLGDYIDRGSDSKGVIDIILDLQDSNYQVFPLRGNHEEMLLDSINSDDAFYQWKRNGANHTLDSFNIINPNFLDKKYLYFFKNLKYYFELDEFILVHAGMNFDIINPFSDLKSMVWTRYPYIDLKKTHGKRLIVGHTPLPFKAIEASLQTPQIYIDGGCVYAKSYESLGNLVALELNSMELYTVYSLDIE